MTVSRRQFIAASTAATAIGNAATRPNVVLIITDDQGFGDVGLHGNAKIRTPNMDRIAREGVQFTRFQVCPVCSPTRASLMTGRYNYRTGVVDTFLGRSLMYPTEVTLPDLLRRAGYRTGIFGKWHLGDNYPLRPKDRGFEKSVVIKGGGLGQPSDFPGGGSYTGPILLNDGKAERFKGYCTDIFTNEALRFIDDNKSRPFFVYLATNAPHDPLQVPDERAVQAHRDTGLDEQTARTYAMVENVDANIGRVLEKLRTHGLERDTIVIFMTDNGPQRARYNAKMRGIKGTVYDGGIRVPFFVRWPAVVKAGSRVDRIAAHIDVMPTLLSACGVARPKQKIDGRSLMPLLQNPSAEWQDRRLFTQWHRGDRPEPFRSCAVRTQRWKLVNGPANREELFDMEADPAEKNDVSEQHRDIVEQLRTAYEEWFRDVSGTHEYAPVRIPIGTKHENPVILTRQDWRGPQAGWTETSLGYWEVDVAEAGMYEFTALFKPRNHAVKVQCSLNGSSVAAQAGANDTTLIVGTAQVRKGPGRLQAEVLGQLDVPYGVDFIEIRRV
jgi:arylsulfatase A-like enzyme